MNDQIGGMDLNVKIDTLHSKVSKYFHFFMYISKS